MNLSIIIPVYNNWSFTKNCLQDLSELPDDHEIIVVDNGSTPTTAKGIKKHFPRVVYKRLNFNMGFSKGCNEGYSISVGENVMFLNNDIRVEDNKRSWTQEILNNIDHNSLVGPTAGMLDKDFNFISETLPGETINLKSNLCYHYMSGWNLSASKKTFSSLIINNYKGPFTEEFGGSFWEDTDLSFRARELNIPFKIVDVPVIHFGHKTANEVGLSSLYIKSKLRFMDKWKTRALDLPLLRGSS